MVGDLASLMALVADASSPAPPTTPATCDTVQAVDSSSASEDTIIQPGVAGPEPQHCERTWGTGSPADQPASTSTATSGRTSTGAGMSGTADDCIVPGSAADASHNTRVDGTCVSTWQSGDAIAARQTGKAKANGTKLVHTKDGRNQGQGSSWLSLHAWVSAFRLAANTLRGLLDFVAAVCVSDSDLTVRNGGRVRVWGEWPDGSPIPSSYARTPAIPLGRIKRVGRKLNAVSKIQSVQIVIMADDPTITIESILIKCLM